MSKAEILYFVFSVIIGIYIAPFAFLDGLDLNFFKFALSIIFTVFSLFLSLRKECSDKMNRFFKFYGAVIFISGIAGVLVGFDGIVFSWVISVFTLSPMLGFLYLYKLFGFPYGANYISWLDSGLFGIVCIAVGIALITISKKRNNNISR